MMGKKNKKRIEIEGMMCNHCAKKVEEVLNSIENINKVKVNLKDKSALIFYQNFVNDEEIKNKIAELEYKVIKIEEI